MKRTKYRIVPHNATKGWFVYGDNKRWWPNKLEAIKYYAALCRKVLFDGGLAQLVICRRDGTVQEERTYGKDPKRSKG